MPAASGLMESRIYVSKRLCKVWLHHEAMMDIISCLGPSNAVHFTIRRTKLVGGCWSGCFTCSGGTKDMTAWPEYRHRINTSSSNNYRSDVTLWMLGNKSIHLITWFLHDSLIWTWDWFISWSHTVRIPEGFRCVRVWERVFFHGRVAGLNLSKLWKSMRAKQEHNPPSPFQLIKCAVNLK